MALSDTNVYEYLKAVAARRDDTLRELYANAGACRCIFESLPDLAKQYVMRLVPCGEIWVVLDEWVAEGAALEQHRESCERLSELRIMEKRAAQGGKEEYRLHTQFREQMLEWLCGSEKGRWQRAPAATKDKGTTVEAMQASASKKWEKVLQFMLSGGEPPSPTVVEVLRKLKLIDAQHTIRSEGYSYLLHDLSTQLWLFVRMYIESASERAQIVQRFGSEDGRFGDGCLAVEEGTTVTLLPVAAPAPLTEGGAQWWRVRHAKQPGDTKAPPEGRVPAECVERHRAAEMLVFLFQLSFVQLGQDVGIEQLTAGQRQFKEELADIGLVYRRKSNSRRFYATRLALQLATFKGEAGGVEPPPASAGGESALGAALGGEAWSVIVESNFKVYAYTASEHIVLLLNLFLRVEYLLPNLVVGTITDKSINEAFDRGITATQILSFLGNHAHPRMSSGRGAAVPETVADQIYLWERELPRNRIAHSDAMLYDQWPSLDVFRRVVGRAHELGAHRWSSEEGMLLVVSAEKHASMDSFYRSLMR